MERIKSGRLRLRIPIFFVLILDIAECVEIKAKQGDAIVFDLPGVKACGQYSLLDPSLRPVVITEDGNIPTLIGSYSKRGSVSQTDEGFKLTLPLATEADAGEYKVAPSGMSLSPPCVTESFYVTVMESLEEFFAPWEEWSFCISQCSAHRRRSRSRKCSVIGGCQKLGPTFQTETCDKADHCPHWSIWGSWGQCSAKCGKGFKIRQRVCLSGNSSLVKNSDCRGPSSQSYICLTVCEVVGTWADWSEWSNCSQSCDSDVTETGTRTRSRICSTDGQRLVTQNCTGNRAEEEPCLQDCTPSTTLITESTIGTTEAVFVGVPEAVKEKSINFISVIAGSTCAFAIIIILVVVIVLKNRVHRRRESVPTLRPAEAASNRRKKHSKERKSSNPNKNSGNGSGNVYSEFNSSANANSFWPSTEFDSVYAIDNQGLHRPSNATVMETIPDVDEGEGEGHDEYSDDSEFDDFPEVAAGQLPTVCERKEIIYEKSRASCQRTNMAEFKSKNSSVESEDYVVTENECYEPPELWSNEDVRHSFMFDSLPRFEGGVGEVKAKPQTDDELESVYYEPPPEEEMDEASKRAEMKRQESEMSNDSVYENCDINRGAVVSMLSFSDKHRSVSVDSTDYYEIPENRRSAEVKANTANDTSKLNIDKKEDVANGNYTPGLTDVRMRNGSIVTIDERFQHIPNEDLDSEHIYANGTVTKDIRDFYVTPKYNYGLGMRDHGSKIAEHIYDIPKF